MALTVLITRDVEDRYRGFLASAMLEVAPGVYSSPHLLISQKYRRQKLNFHDAAESDPHEARWTKPCAQHS